MKTMKEDISPWEQNERSPFAKGRLTRRPWGTMESEILPPGRAKGGGNAGSHAA